MKCRYVITQIVILSFLFVIIGCNQDQKALKKSENRITSIAEEDSKDGILNQSDFDIELPNLPTKKYVADKDHSSISFKTKHWEIVDIIGWLSDFDIVMYSDKPDFSDAIISARVFPTSLKMPNIKMEGSAQKHPYMDSENFPEMTFMSREMKPLGDNKYELAGRIKINGIEKKITFDVRFNGFAYPNEQSICGFDVHGKINRNDFKIAGDATLHSGKLIHNDTINIHLSLRME